MTSAGDVSSAAEFTAARNPATTVATRTTAQSIPNNATTAISWDGEEFDNAGMITPTSTTFTIPEDAVYTISATIAYTANATGFRGVEVYLNGTGVDGGYATSIGVGAQSKQNYSCEFLLAAADAVEIHAYQNSGGALNVTGARAAITRRSG